PPRVAPTGEKARLGGTVKGEKSIPLCHTPLTWFSVPYAHKTHNMPTRGISLNPLFTKILSASDHDQRSALLTEYIEWGSGGRWFESSRPDVGAAPHPRGRYTEPVGKRPGVEHRPQSSWTPGPARWA